jgi:hypothetical protein
MATNGGPKIPQQNLKVYLDVNNPDCSGITSPSTGLTNDLRLNNLVVNDDIEYFYNDQNTEAYQDAVLHKSGFVLRHNALDGSTKRDTTWRANIGLTRVNSYTFISWFKFDNTGQQSENIYGGGFDSRTSFYMSPGGTSASHGVLNYSDAGSANGYSTTSDHGANDGNWHMRAYTVTGPDVGVQTTKFYVDGVLKQTNNSNSSHDNPDGTNTMRWGSWTGGYGNLAGDLNHFIYYERVLSDDEILNIYNITKTKYQ